MKLNTQQLYNILKKNAKNGRVTMTYEAALKAGLKFKRRQVETIITYEEYSPSRISFANHKKELVKMKLLKRDSKNNREPVFIVSKLK